jgi:ADP-ribosylglycohydrolase
VSKCLKLSAITILGTLSLCAGSKLGLAASVEKGRLVISEVEYRDRARAIWLGQMIGQLTGLRYEHRPASILANTPLRRGEKYALPDDDYYYEMVALRAFEKYGIDMTVQQLGAQWLENSAGSWGSSEQALLLLKRGIQPPDTGSPRYNRLWWTIGPQFSSDIYGTLAPGMPNVAAAMARRYGHINGYAEGTDGAVFISGMISLGFVETDTKEIVRKAARLISPLSPYRQCLDDVIAMADAGKQPQEIFRALEDRWGIEYPATNNAVLNGGIVATSVWFGRGDFFKTENLAFTASDFADTDCNAANSASVVAAMHGMAALPPDLVASFKDRVFGDKMGPVALTPPVDESISALGNRTAVVGEKILLAHGARHEGDNLDVPIQQPVTQPAEVFKLSDFTKLWNQPDWTLERAGFGGGTGGIWGIPGQTYLDGDVLAIFPRDEVRGALLRRTLELSNKPSLSFDVAADQGRAWHLSVFVNNDRVFDKLIEGEPQTAPPSPRPWIPTPQETESKRHWEHVQVDLSAYKGQSVTIRFYDLILVPEYEAGNSYWKNLNIQ